MEAPQKKRKFHDFSTPKEVVVVNNAVLTHAEVGNSLGIPKNSKWIHKGQLGIQNEFPAKNSSSQESKINYQEFKMNFGIAGA